MSKIEDGGPAFPCPEASLVHYNYPQAYMGLTMRDYFAAAALQGFLANSSNEFAMLRHDNLASEAYMVADAMLESRKEAQL